jgi:hypothetical protein
VGHYKIKLTVGYVFRDEQAGNTKHEQAGNTKHLSRKFENFLRPDLQFSLVMHEHIGESAKAVRTLGVCLGCYMTH